MCSVIFFVTVSIISKNVCNFLFFKGNTGFPLVDAAMRQLWAVGWMNNYMRHVVASFLISYLRISWVEGYKWFQDTLLDADIAINGINVFLDYVVLFKNIFYKSSFYLTFFINYTENTHRRTERNISSLHSNTGENCF